MPKLTLELSGKELALLYIATGNEDAGRYLREAVHLEREEMAKLRLTPRREKHEKQEEQAN